MNTSSTASTGPAGVELFRHALATLAYRGGKAVRGAPPDFGGFRSSDTTRTPANILAHIGDLMDWTLSILKGVPAWKDSRPIAWEEEIGRFHASIGSLDSFLSSGKPDPLSLQKLFQGPIADAFTHVGQLTLLRRMAGSPIRGENYFIADIETGRVGPEQAPARREFG
jgi:hypothetical protein